MSFRTPARDLLALFLAPLLCACVSGPPELRFDPDAPPDPTKHAKPVNWQGSWDKLREQLGAEDGTTSIELHTGQRLSAEGVLIRGRLPKPTRPAAEILIVIEGLGVLHTRSGSHPLEPGTIAILEAGSRTEVQSLSDELAGVLLRSTETGVPKTPAADRVIPYPQAFPPDLDPQGSKENLELRLGEIPGRLAARSLSIGLSIPRHLHAQHDEFLVLIRGWGTIGLGSDGASRQFTSAPLRERALVFIGQTSTHSYSDEEGRTFAIAVSAGPGPLERDTLEAVARDALGSHSLGHVNQMKRGKAKED